MPLFFYISGYVFYLAYCKKRYERKKNFEVQLLNLVWVYCLFSIVLWIFKMCFVGNVNKQFTFNDLILIPIKPLGEYWYLYVLIFGNAGFILRNTLSDNGTVTRGICLADENDMLTKVVETTGIQANMDGQILCDNEEVKQWIHPDVKVSMNMWAAYPKFFEHLEEGFHLFLQNLKEDSHKKEYLLPNIVDHLIQEKEMNVKVLETKDHWFGITYKNDKEVVKSAFSQLIAEGMYPEQLCA